MKTIFKMAGIASAALLAGTLTASAALIDFTDSTTGLAGAEGGGWTVTSGPAGTVPTFMNTVDFGCTNPALVCDYDGLGVNDDEIAVGGAGFQWLTITFTDKVKLAAAHFLDLYISPADAGNFETAYISKGPGPVPALVAASKAAVEVRGGTPGYAELSPLSLKGTTFTFWVDPAGNDDAGRPDYAVAALEIAPVPLPAGLLLLGTALGGFGLARRKRK